MAFSILGSILSKLCDSFNCSFGTLCNCSQTKIIVLGENSPAARSVVEVCRRQQNLDDALKEVELQEVRSLKMRTITQLDETQTDAHKAAILHIVQSSLNLLSSAPRIRCAEEGMARFRTATQLAGLGDLQQYYQNSIPLTTEDLKGLRHHIKRIQKYGSSAVHLWQLLKDHLQVDGARLKDMNINPRQAALLEGIFLEKSRVCKDFFSELDLPAKELFLRAAKYYSKREIDQHGFLSWIAPGTNEFSESSETLPSASSSENLRSLAADLGVKGERGVPFSKNNLLGFKRAALLYSLAESGEDMPDDPSDTQIIHWRRLLPRLQQVDGMMFYLFLALRESIEFSTLAKNYELNYELYQEVRKALRVSPSLAFEVRIIEDLSRLSVNHLKLLYQIADKAPEDLLSQMAQKYPLRCWITAPPRAHIARRKSDPG